MKEIGLQAKPLDFNPPPIVASTRAHARLLRLLEMRDAGEDVPADEIERHREAAFGRRDVGE